MTGAYLSPSNEGRAELVVSRSRFVSTAGFTPSVAEAREFIDRIRAEFPDAAHVPYAFAVGHGASVIHGAGDDGEPSGTAGPPTLAVVRGSGLGDVCVVTARYFGGTKLGTGGLVKAFTEAAQSAIAATSVARRVDWVEVRLDLDYGLYDTIARVAAQHGAEVVEEQLGAGVTWTLRLDRDALGAFEAEVAAASAGRVELETGAG